MNIRLNVFLSGISHSKYQHGFSLIELMISMLLGVFLIGGLISVFIASSQNYRVQQALTQVQDKGRFAVKKMREDVQQAGFDIVFADVAVQYFPVAGAGSCALGLAVFETYWTEGAVDKRRCYYLENNQLKRNETDDLAVPVAANAIVIIDGITQLDFTFAIDLDGGGLDKVAGVTYLTAADLIVGNGGTPATTATWQSVRAVRVEMIVVSDTGNVTTAEQVLVNPFGKNPAVNFNAPADDLRLYQAFSATYALRNRIE
ncbi:MAG: PilW family protein [Pseudomonadales bacterium]|nr:PilW family protein [Pseudomonadales bacterium]NRA18206.1 PilW family protein [Oceanospirillaceae bacterium]